MAGLRGIFFDTSILVAGIDTSAEASSSMNQKIKEFDSVQLMRRLRDRLSEEMAPMSPQERILYIQRKAKASPLFALFGHNTRQEVSSK
ncbi:MAG TPA: hypothetical protein VF173_17730 [Thermoanaerobaculia bacterium]|nr:hypothetical protein [Thermoanaerobaculia bacterium]